MHYRIFLLLLAAGPLLGCGKQPYDDGLTKHQVTGVVTVNGQPLDHVIVRFQSTDSTVTGNAAQPVGFTDSAGKYAMSTSGDKDGAVAGEYVLMFLRNDPNSDSGNDIFRNRFTNPAQSKHKVTVPDHDLEVPPIDLDIPPQWLTTPPRKGIED
ncbi:hypothetical protein [Blastopirellula retiformator]|uniref:Carboxypeptidase regulatory-like domain-containing protein n=1 Tax=Blastopirellula retiformator TaxID=2527970 RepID=A0A5C5V1E2_9BACT|nr:hypothetical protein [Blastopirellula retiformator]TWT31813.1 hypothetical protein Enr8_37380 [Blastopirellula retiformator]